MYLKIFDWIKCIYHFAVGTEVYTRLEAKLNLVEAGLSGGDLQHLQLSRSNKNNAKIS